MEVYLFQNEVSSKVAPLPIFGTGPPILGVIREMAHAHVYWKAGVYRRLLRLEKSRTEKKQFVAAITSKQL